MTAQLPLPANLRSAKALAAVCKRCDLYRNATQTVFGEGPAGAPVMLVGEQPGDSEDLAGRPFVGPSGRLLDAALRDAGVDRSKCFITNAVKHFKNEPRGKRRLHKRPNAHEIDACNYWLQVERGLVKPELVVALGGTAAASLTGNGNDILARRGTFERLPDGTPVLLTVHPSTLLRIRDRGSRAGAMTEFQRDLSAIATVIPAVSL